MTLSVPMDRTCIVMMSAVGDTVRQSNESGEVSPCECGAARAKLDLIGGERAVELLEHAIDALVGVGQRQLLDDRHEIVAVRTEPVKPDHGMAGCRSGFNFDRILIPVRCCHAHCPPPDGLLARIADFGRNDLQISSRVSI